MPSGPYASESSKQHDPLIGVLLDGKYRIERLIGRGGVGVVYLAHEIAVDREVVIKILASNWLGNAEILARFDREVERLSGLQHANIVSLYGHGRHDGRTYMVLEYIKGELLKGYLARKGRLPLEDFVPIAGQILKGMGYAHSRGLMHRDLNPSNIMLCVRDNRAHFVKILDFGLAKLKEGETKVTEQHDLVGTAGYLAPEQIKGEEVDLRVDVYALGVMFYHMLSGHMPFEGEHNATLLYKHVHEKPPPLQSYLPPEHGIPQNLIRLIHDCLEKNPEQRPEDANEIVEDLIDCVPAALFRLPEASAVDLKVIDEESGATMVGLGIQSPGGGAVDSILTFASQAARTSGPQSGPHKGPPRPILVEVPDDDEPRPFGESLRADTDPEASTPTLRAGVAASEDPSIDASTSTLKPARSFVPHSRTPTSQVAPIAAPQRRSTGLLIGAALALLTGAGFAYLFLAGPPTPAAVGAGALDEAAIKAALQRAEAAVEGRDFQAATHELDTIRAAVHAYPALEAKAERITEKIVVGQLIATARKLEREGNLGAARAAYKDVVTRDATNAEAREAIARLTVDTAPEGSTAVLSVSSTPVADLYIDGTSMGATPFSGPVAVGRHAVKMTAEGYQPWESTLDVEQENNVPLQVTLRPLAKVGGGKAPKIGGTKPATPATPPATDKPTTPATPDKPAPQPAEGDKDGDLFLPTKKPKDSGIFLPVGG